MIDEPLRMIIQAAQSKALASYSLEYGLNVVPVSTITIRDGKIILMNYFMNKTLANISKEKKVALTCWKDLQGIQIKADAEHQTEGSLFNEMKAWVSEILPDRILRGILILSPTEVFDISADANRAGTKLY